MTRYCARTLAFSNSGDNLGVNLIKALMGKGFIDLRRYYVKVAPDDHEFCEQIYRIIQNSDQVTFKGSTNFVNNIQGSQVEKIVQITNVTGDVNF